MIGGIWEVSWNLVVMITKIKEHIKEMEAVVVHVHREGNKLVDFLANQVFIFDGLDKITYLL